VLLCCPKTFRGLTGTHLDLDLATQKRTALIAEHEQLLSFIVLEEKPSTLFGGGLEVSHLAAVWRSTPIAFVGPSEGRFRER
jgi:hypothetical protein